MEFVIAALLAAIAGGVWVIVGRGPRAVHAVIALIIDRLSAAAELKALAELVVTLEEDPTRIKALGVWSREQYAAVLSRRLQIVDDAIVAVQGQLATSQKLHVGSGSNSYLKDAERAKQTLIDLGRERLRLQRELDDLADDAQA